MSAFSFAAQVGLGHDENAGASGPAITFRSISRIDIALRQQREALGDRRIGDRAVQKAVTNDHSGPDCRARYC